MENKLQELTKKLYDEGLSKGRKEAQEMVEHAQTQAKKIISEAEAEAARIRKAAEKAAEDTRKNTLTELNLAGKQAVGELKGDIESMIVTKAAAGAVRSASLDPKFVEEALIAVAKNWKGASAEKVSLKAMLPKDMDEKMKKQLEESVRGALGEGLQIAWSDGVKSGFTIGPKDGGYRIGFTEKDFYALLDEYLRPKVREILYGENKEK